MKKILLYLLLTIPFFAFSADNEKGFDKKIDESFGKATGWFVKGIFYEIPIGNVSEEKTIDLTLESPENVKLEIKNDTLFYSDIKLSGGQIAKKIESGAKIAINGGSFAIAKSDADSLQEIKIQLSSSYINIPWVLIVLVAGAVFFTVYFKFVNFRHFLTAINIVRGHYDDIDHIDPQPEDAPVHTVEGDIVDTIRVEGQDGEVSHFQALTAALSGTVGLGNIAGVAIAVALGGPGATFWMITAGLLGMASKFTECTLGVKFREIREDGVVFGGPMYYLKKGLATKGLGGLGSILAVIFAIMCIGGSFGGGNMFQSNQAFKMLESITMNSEGVSPLSGYGFLFGIVMAILVAVVIIGGIKSIAKVTDKIVPLMVGVYVLASLIIIFANISYVGEAISQIFSGAFSGEGIVGGAVGVLIMGFRRAAFSNEAGIGSASIAHSAVKTKYPASEGLVALMEPFIDTVVVCTMTAIVIVVSNLSLEGKLVSYGAGASDGVALTSDAFASVIPWFPYILTVAVILFAFSTMISWSYYGFQAWSFLFGKTKTMEYVYKGLFCLFVIIGAAASLGSVIDFSDAMIFAMMVPNMVGLVILAPYVTAELKKYLSAIKTVKAK